MINISVFGLGGGSKGIGVSVDDNKNKIVDGLKLDVIFFWVGKNGEVRKINLRCVMNYGFCYLLRLIG